MLVGLLANSSIQGEIRGPAESKSLTRSGSGVVLSAIDLWFSFKETKSQIKSN